MNSFTLVKNFEFKLFLTNQSPLRSRKKANCHKFIDKLAKALQQNADSDATMRIFLLPYVSDKKPHKWDVKIMPDKEKIRWASTCKTQNRNDKVNTDVFLSVTQSQLLTSEPNSRHDSVLLLRCYVQITFGYRQCIVDAHRFEERWSHEHARDENQEIMKFPEPFNDIKLAPERFNKVQRVTCSLQRLLEWHSISFTFRFFENLLDRGHHFAARLMNGAPWKIE